MVSPYCNIRPYTFCIIQGHKSFCHICKLYSYVPVLSTVRTYCTSNLTVIRAIVYYNTEWTSSAVVRGQNEALMAAKQHPPRDADWRLWHGARREYAALNANTIGYELPSVQLQSKKPNTDTPQHGLPFKRANHDPPAAEIQIVLPKKRKRGERSRSWLFTINNWTPSDYDTVLALQPKPKYLIVGKEIGEDNKLPHLQGYVRFPNAVTRRSLSKKLPRAHLKIAKGTDAQNREYCSKDGDYHEYGERPRIRRRHQAPPKPKSADKGKGAGSGSNAKDGGSANVELEVKLLVKDGNGVQPVPDKIRRAKKEYESVQLVGKNNSSTITKITDGRVKLRLRINAVSSQFNNQPFVICIQKKTVDSTMDVEGKSIVVHSVFIF